MKRRNLLAGAAGLALPPLLTPLLSPSVLRAQGTTGASQVLRFIPQSDLTVLDPHWTTAYVTRNHAFMVFDTLYGTNGAYEPSPQMVAGHTTDADAKLWRLTLRDGLMFHDGTPVLARDCVASIKRWGKKDGFGQALLAATDDLSADGDKVIVFRLKHPFPLLPAALGKNTVYMPAIMPERLAMTDANTQVQEMVGSGPFRFVAAERVPGSMAVYRKFEGYKPRETGRAGLDGRPKDRAFRPCRVAHHPRPRHRRRRPAIGGDRLVGLRHRRSAAAAEKGTRG